MRALARCKANGLQRGENRVLDRGRVRRVLHVAEHFPMAGRRPHREREVEHAVRVLLRIGRVELGEVQLAHAPEIMPSEVPENIEALIFLNFKFLRI